VLLSSTNQGNTVKNLFSFSAEGTRLQVWMTWAALMASKISIAAAEATLPDLTELAIAVFIFLLMMHLVAIYRRLKTLKMSGAWAWACFLPFVYLPVLLYTGFKKAA
jgi:uncharacterized membrane protein YhaH (DUF805 family)